VYLSLSLSHMGWPRLSLSLFSFSPSLPLSLVWGGLVYISLSLSPPLPQLSLPPPHSPMCMRAHVPFLRICVSVHPSHSFSLLIFFSPSLFLTCAHAHSLFCSRPRCLALALSCSCSLALFFWLSRIPQFANMPTSCHHP